MTIDTTLATKTARNRTLDLRSFGRTFLGIAALFSVAACSEIVTAPPPAPPAPPPVAAAPNASVPRTVDTSSPTAVRAEIVRYFSHAGYQKAHVDALVSQARVESGFRPCATNGSNLRYLYQWSGRRLQQLDRFADAHGHCPTLEKQLAFADNELRHEPNYACFLEATMPSGALSALRRGFGHGSC